MKKQIDYERNLISQNVELLVGILNRDKIEDIDIPYFKELLNFLNSPCQNNNYIYKLIVLHKLLQAKNYFDEKGIILFQTLQTIVLILNFPTAAIKKVIEIFEEYVKELEKLNLMNLSDEEKITRLIDNYLLKNAKSTKFQTLKYSN